MTDNKYTKKTTQKAKPKATGAAAKKAKPNTKGRKSK